MVDHSLIFLVVDSSGTGLGDCSFIFLSGDGSGVWLGDLSFLSCDGSGGWPLFTSGSGLGSGGSVLSEPKLFE